MGRASSRAAGDEFNPACQEPRPTGGISRNFVKFSRAWVDSFRKTSKNGLALPMLAMGTEMKTQRATRDGRGFTLTELLVVICGRSSLLAVISLPATSLRKTESVANYVCQPHETNGIDVRVWAGDHGNKSQCKPFRRTTRYATCRQRQGFYLLWQIMSNDIAAPQILHLSRGQAKITKRFH